METLLTYLNSLTPDQQRAYAARCGTSVGYLRKAISVRQRISSELAIELARESKGKVTVDSIRPDVDWAFVRTSAAQEGARV